MVNKPASSNSAQQKSVLAAALGAVEGGLDVALSRLVDGTALLGDDGNASLLVGDNTDSLKVCFSDLGRVKMSIGESKPYLVVDKAGVLFQGQFDITYIQAWIEQTFRECLLVRLRGSRESSRPPFLPFLAR